MTRLNTDNVAGFFSVDTFSLEPQATRTEPKAPPFDDFLQRAGRSPETEAKDVPRESENRPRPSEDSDPIDEQSRTTEPDRETEEDRNASETTSDTDRPEATDTQSDEQTDEQTDQQVDAAIDGRSDESINGKEQATVAVTEIGLAGGDQQTGDDADSATEDAQSRDARTGTKNGPEDGRSESGAAQDAKPDDASGLSQQTGQTPVESEAATEEESTNLREQGNERKPGESSEGTPQPTAGGDKVATESKDRSNQSDVDNPLATAATPQGRQMSSEEPRRRTARQGSRGEVDQSSQTVAKTLAGQETVTGGAQVEAEELAAATEETKSAAAEKAVKPTSATEVKDILATPSKGWAPEGLRSTAAPLTGDSTQTDQVDRVRFVQRVARAFGALGEGDGTMRLRLKPPELGGLRLEVSIRNGLMTAHIETETSAARTLLLDNLPALRERLAQQNIKVDSFDVDLADRSPDDSPQQPDDNRQPRDRTDGQKARTAENQDGDTADVGSVRPVTRIGEGARLDVVI